MASATFRGSVLRGPEANDPWLPKYGSLVVYTEMPLVAKCTVVALVSLLEDRGLEIKSSFTQLRVRASSRRGRPRARAVPRYLVRPVQESF